MIPPVVIFIFFWLLFLCLVNLNIFLYKRKKSKKVLFFSVIIWLIILYYLFINVIYPAYLSKSYDCTQDYSILNDTGYVITGTTSTSCNSNNQIEVKLYNEDPKTLNHEVCHLNQKIERRLGECDGMGLKLYFNEVECYILQNIDYRIWSNLTME